MCSSYIQKVLGGDIEAFRFIIKEHKDDAYSLAISVVNDEFTAQDVVQNAFIKAYNNLNTFNRESKFSTWLYRIVINEAFIKQRKQKRQTRIAGGLSETTVSPPINNTILKIDEENQRFYINETLKRMPANYSLALRLFYLQDYTVEEITKVTGWSDSNAKVILHRARNKARLILNDILNIDKEELY